MVEGVRSFRLRPGDTIMLQPLTQDFCFFYRRVVNRSSNVQPLVGVLIEDAA